MTPTPDSAALRSALEPTDLGKCLFCGYDLRWQTDDIEGWIAHLYCVGCDFLGPMSEFKYDDVQEAKADSWNRWTKGISTLSQPLPAEREAGGDVVGVDSREAIARIVGTATGTDPWWWKSAFDDGYDETASRLRNDDLALADTILSILAPAQSSAAAVREALAFDTGSDASLNLQAALDDLVSDRYKLADGGVIERTLQRVIYQIEQVRALPLPEPDEAGGEAVAPVAYRYVHLDYAGRKVSRYGAYPERVNGHDPIETHPLYAHPATQPTGDEPVGLRELLCLVKDMLPLIEPARLREQAAALEGSLQRMPVRQIVRRAKVALTTPSQPDEAAQPADDAWMLAHEVEGDADLPTERERIVAWLRYLAGVFVTPSVLASFGDTAGRDGQLLCVALADAIERGDHLAGEG